jgi:NTE family protein
VFKGGSVRGIAYMGALKAMDEQGLLRRIEQVAGTSSGAIASLLFSFRLPVSRMHALFDTLDLSKVPQNRKKTDGLTKKILPLKSATSYRRLFEVFGWYFSEYFYQWEKNIIADHCQGNALATFNDFREYGYRDLYIVF